MIDDQPERRATASTIGQLSVPYGFTMTVAGSLAVLIGRRGYPGFLGVWLFVVGGSLAYCILAVVSRAHIGAGPAPAPRRRRAVVNLAPVVALPVDDVAVRWVENDHLAFGLAGWVAVLAYVLCWSGYRRWVVLGPSGRRRSGARRRSTPPPD